MWGNYWEQPISKGQGAALVQFTLWWPVSLIEDAIRELEDAISQFSCSSQSPQMSSLTTTLSASQHMNALHCKMAFWQKYTFNICLWLKDHWVFSASHGDWNRSIMNSLPIIMLMWIIMLILKMFSNPHVISQAFDAEVSPVSALT